MAFPTWNSVIATQLSAIAARLDAILAPMKDDIAAIKTQIMGDDRYCEKADEDQMNTVEEDTPAAITVAEHLNLQEEMAEISLQDLSGNSTNTTLQIPGSIGATGVQIGDGDIICRNQVCREASLQLSGIKIIQDFVPFSLGGAEVVLGICWLSSLNTIEAKWNDMFIIVTIEGHTYKLQGIPSDPRNHADFQHLVVHKSALQSQFKAQHSLVYDTGQHISAPISSDRLEDKSFLRPGSSDTNPAPMEQIHIIFSYGFDPVNPDLEYGYVKGWMVLKSWKELNG